MPKAKSEKKSAQLRHAPLSTELEHAVNPPLTHKTKKRSGRDGEDFEEDETVEDLGGAPEKSLNAKIFNQARDQRLEEQSRKASSRSPSAGKPVAMPLSNDSDDDYEDDVDEEEEEDDAGYIQYDGDNEYVQTAGLNEHEEAVVNRFLSAGQAETRTLADIILEKLNGGGGGGENGTGDAMEGASTYDGPEASTLPPKVVEVYTAVGALLAHYKSGKVPKALKMLPHLRNWEDILWITRPDNWSPGAAFICTRIFASNLNQRMSQRFFNLVLLEKVRDDIRNQGKLNYHLYMSLKKALFKPASFYKGILLPLAQSGTCTLKEATIIGSVLAKVSIPMNHSAAALLRLCEMRYSGTTSLFIRILVNKKYSLPRRVVDGLVTHFCGFMSDTREMPVIWHQSLLVFAQRYKLEVSNEQREQLKELLKVHTHHQITQEVRRELFNSVNEARTVAGMEY